MFLRSLPAQANVRSEGYHDWEMGLEWIESRTEKIAAAGWSTLGAVLKIKSDNELDLAKIGELLDQVFETTHNQPNRLRVPMNGFEIDTRFFVDKLTDRSLEVVAKIGLVKVKMVETAYKVQSARESIETFKAAGKLGKKRKTASADEPPRRPCDVRAASLVQLEGTVEILVRRSAFV